MCSAGITHCVSANFGWEMAGQQLRVEYFKGCRDYAKSSCGAIEEDLKKILDGTGIEVNPGRCHIETCEGDLCNTKTAQEVKDLG